MKKLKSSKFAAYLLKFLLKAVLKTCQVQVIGRDNIVPAKEKGPLVIALWHNRLAIISEILMPFAGKLHFTSFISQSRDGELLVQFANTYPSNGVIRVGHDSKSTALRNVINTVNKNETILLITPDGPRGPVYKLKPGLQATLEETEASLITFTWDADKFWELKTWDKFRFPKPFSKITASFSEPMAKPSPELIANKLTKPFP